MLIMQSLNSDVPTGLFFMQKLNENGVHYKIHFFLGISYVQRASHPDTIHTLVSVCNIILRVWVMRTMDFEDKLERRITGMKFCLK